MLEVCGVGVGNLKETRLVLSDKVFLQTSGRKT